MLKRFFYENTIEAGVDEAGKGPLFGRVYVGAVVLPQGDEFDHSLMRDSKKLSPKKRQIAYDYIKKHALDWTFFWVSAEDIDKINIYKATHLAMHKALDQLKVRPENILVDGNKFYVYKHDNEIIPHICITGGDNKYTSIAAASIIAKVEHDKYINEMCDAHPNLDTFYDLRNNKGYGTKKHIEGIKQHGISSWHRKTFGICRLEFGLEN
jgi:ribonuclease HII